MPDQSGIGVIHAPGRAAFTAHGPDWTAQYQEVAGRTAQDYRKRIDLLDDEHTSNPSPQAQTDTPDLVYQRRTRFVLELEKLDARNVGMLLYFYFIVCYYSAVMLGVDPFDQPGVENYKQEMFRLLGAF